MMPTDRETLLAALKHCAPGIRSCDRCPYNTECHGTTNAAMAHAIQFIQPRVLSISEAAAEPVAWIETRGSVIVSPCHFLLFRYSDRTETFVQYLGNDTDAVNPEEFGVTFRLWSARPTKQQRDATPWPSNPHLADDTAKSNE